MGKEYTSSYSKVKLAKSNTMVRVKSPTNKVAFDYTVAQTVMQEVVQPTAVQWHHWL